MDVFIYQASCNHHIFDSGCGIDYFLWKVDATILQVNGTVLTSDQLLGFGTDYFVGGEVNYYGDARLITAYSGNTITLHVPFDSRVTVGTVVEVFPNCGGDPQKCRDVFNNFDHFLGCPYIPDKNPAVWGV